MEDKVFLDEAGLNEVGKVLSKFYASKDDIDILAKNLQLLQCYNNADHNNPKEVKPTFSVLTGSYILQPFRALANQQELYRSYSSIYVEPLIGIMLVYRMPDYNNISSSKVKIYQRIFDLNNQIVLMRYTLDKKEEYDDKWICQHYTGDDFIKFCQQIRWTDWEISEEDSQPLRVASSTQIGLMASEDKIKLDSINIEDIKLLTQRVEALESKMH